MVNISECSGFVRVDLDQPVSLPEFRNNRQCYSLSIFTLFENIYKSLVWNVQQNWENTYVLQGAGVRRWPILPQAHPPSQVMYRFYFSSYRYRYLTVIIWKLWKKGSRKFLKLAFLKLNCITSMKPFQVFNCLNIAVSKIASHPKVHNSTLWREINVVGSICRNKLTRLTCRQCLAFLQTFHYPAPSQSTAHATTSTLSTSERLKLLRFSFSSSKDKKSYQLINNIV